MDQSNNLDPASVQRELDYVLDLVLDAASVDVDHSRMALVTYAETARVQFHLGNFTDRHLLLDSISAFHSCVYPLMYSRVVHGLG